MLVLSRKAGEKVFVGPDIVITILSSGRSRTKIGIEAPSDVQIRRGELPEVGPLNRSPQRQGKTEELSQLHR